MKAKNVKKVIQSVSLAGTALLMATGVSAAEAPGWVPDALTTASGVFDIESIVRLGLYLVIVAAIIWALWNVIRAGLEWTGAAEDPEKKKSATQRIINAIIGLIIVVASFTILSLVSNWFGGDLAGSIGQPCVATGNGATPGREDDVGIVQRFDDDKHDRDPCGKDNFVCVDAEDTGTVIDCDVTE